MGKYIHYYETENAFNAAYNGSDYHEPWVSYTNETGGQEHVNYNKEPAIEWIWKTYGNKNPYPELVAIVESENWDAANALFYAGTTTGITPGTVAGIEIPSLHVSVAFTGQETGVRFVSPTALTYDDFVVDGTKYKSFVFLWSDDTPLDATRDGGCLKCLSDTALCYWYDKYNNRWSGYGPFCDANECFCAVVNNKKYLYIMYSD